MHPPAAGHQRGPLGIQPRHDRTALESSGCTGGYLNQPASIGEGGIRV